MRRSTFTPEQIPQALRQAEGGTAVVDVCRKLAVAEATFSRRTKPYAGLDVSERRELKRRWDENRRLKAALADPPRDESTLRDALGKTW